MVKEVGGEPMWCGGRDGIGRLGGSGFTAIVPDDAMLRFESFAQLIRGMSKKKGGIGVARRPCSILSAKLHP